MSGMCLGLNCIQPQC